MAGARAPWRRFKGASSAECNGASATLKSAGALRACGRSPATGAPSGWTGRAGTSLQSGDHLTIGAGGAFDTAPLRRKSGAMPFVFSKLTRSLVRAAVGSVRLHRPRRSARASADCGAGNVAGHAPTRRGFRVPRIALLAIWVSLAGWPAAAQTVTIRSGEHASFSRLVLYFPTDAGWQLGRSDRGYRLLSMDDSVRFDTSGVFDFMPRSRILSVADGPARLDLEVTCRCHADAFEYRPGIVVVDIKDGAPPTDARFEARIDTDDTRETDQERRAAAPRPLPAPRFPLGGARPQLSPMASPPQALMSEVPDATFLFERGLPDETVASLGSQLAMTLADAMAAGDLVPSRGSTERLDGRPLAAGVSVRTARIAQQERSETEDRCLPDAMFDVTAWRGDLAPTETLAQARATFLDDIDAPDEAAVIAVARRHVALGFGAEAALIVSAFPVESEEGGIVAAMAVIVDNPEAPDLGSNESSALRSQQGCGTAAELWALLAAPAGAVDGARPDIDAVVRVVSALPIHLRRHLAPEVSRRLRALGENEAASMVRSSVTRSDRVPSQELAVETAIGRGEEDATDLREAASGNGATALLAQTLRLQGMARDGRPLPFDLRREVEAQIHQSKGTPDAEALAAAYFRALAASRAYLHALSEIRRLHRSRMLSAANLDTHRSETVLSLATSGSDGDVIVATEALVEHGETRKLSAEARVALRDRLEALGFNRLVQDVAPMPRAMTVPLGNDPAGDAIGARENGRSTEGPGRPDLASNDERSRRNTVDVRGLRAASTAEAAGSAGDVGTRSWLAADWATAAEEIPPGPRRDVARTLASLAATGPRAAAEAGSVPTQRGQATSAAASGGELAAVRLPASQTVGEGDAPAGSRAARDALMDRARALVVASQALRDSAAQLLDVADGPMR